jgi:thioredoxin reductase (NADPH)
MTAAAAPISESRRDQMFPTLAPADIARLRRFGEPRAFAAGEMIARVGDAGMKLMLLISGEVAITQRDELGHRRSVVTHRPGAFIGELAQLTGRPALVDAQAVGAVEVVAIPPERLRDLFVAEAELGETIMRALILRRVGLIEAPGMGAIIVGRPASRDVLRLQGFLRRNSQPNQTLDPETDPEARALIEPCRSCSVRAVSCCAIPAKASSRGVWAWSARSTPIAPMMW